MFCCWKQTYPYKFCQHLPALLPHDLVLGAIGKQEEPKEAELAREVASTGKGCAGPQQGWAVMIVSSIPVHGRAPALQGQCSWPAQQVWNLLLWSCVPGTLQREVARGNKMHTATTFTATIEGAEQTLTPTLEVCWGLLLLCTVLLRALDPWYISWLLGPICCDRVPQTAGALQASFQKLPACPELSPSSTKPCKDGVRPLMHGLALVWGITDSCILSMLHGLLRYVTMLEPGVPRQKGSVPWALPHHAHTGGPFQLHRAQQDNGTHWEAGHSPCPRPSPLLLLRGTAEAGGIQLHIMETEFLL